MSKNYDTERKDVQLDSAMRAYYNERAPEYDDWYERRGRYMNAATNEQWRSEMAVLAKHANSFGHGHLLDLACGTAYWTPRFAARPEVERLTLYDQAPAMLEQAKQRLSSVQKPIEYVQGDVYDLPFAENTFDALFTGFLLSHIPRGELEGFLQSIRRVVKDGAEVMFFDSRWNEDTHAEVEVQHRPLKDGSVHPVLKVYYTEETIVPALAQLAEGGTIVTEGTGTFFVIARLTIRKDHA